MCIECEAINAKLGHYRALAKAVTDPMVAAEIKRELALQADGEHPGAEFLAKIVAEARKG